MPPWPSAASAGPSSGHASIFHPSSLTRVGGLVIDRRSRRVTLDEHELTLTPKEFDLLALLASDVGTVHRRDEILERVWDAHWYGPTKTLDVHVASLRKKLGDPGIIETVRGVGFRVRDDEASPRP